LKTHRDNIKISLEASAFFCFSAVWAFEGLLSLICMQMFWLAGMKFDFPFGGKTGARHSLSHSFSHCATKPIIKRN